MSIDTTKDHEVNKFDIGKAMKQTRIPLICIYDHPKDYPDKFIARLWDCDIPTNIMATADLASLGHVLAAADAGV
jgi:hypothetical protein